MSPAVHDRLAVRECCMGALCNLARKTWITTDLCTELRLLPTLFKSIGVALGRGEEGCVRAFYSPLQI